MSLKDHLMRHLGMFIYQKLYTTGQEVVGQVEQALTLALNQTELQEIHHKEYLDFLKNITLPAAPETKNSTERSQALMTPIHPTAMDSHFNPNLEEPPKSSTDQGIHNQDYFLEDTKKEKEDEKRKYQRNENINFTSFGKDLDEPKPQLSDGLLSDFANGSNNSMEEWRVRHGAKSAVKNQQKNGSEKPSDRKDERTRERKYPCEICGRSFSLKGNLKKHERTHSGEKPYKCEICTKAFILKADLKHTCVHSGEGQRSNLKTHKRTHNEKSSYKEGLKRKELKRKAEQPKINACENGESTQTHTEHKYCCGICGTGFIRESSLSAHLRQLSAAAPYICDICGQVFCQKVSLVKHKSVHC